MTVEDRLRQAMRAESEGVDVDPEAWSKVQAGVRRHRVRRTVGASVLSVAALFAVVVGVVSLLADGDGEQVIVPADSSTSTTEPEPGTTTTLPPSDDEAAFPGLWPFTSQDAVDAYMTDPGVGMFFDAEATALEFAREYLGMLDPVATSTFEGWSGTIDVSPKPGAPMTTSVEVTKRRADGPYFVTGATTANILVDRPEPMQVVGQTIQLTGTSTAFEANVIVEVRQDGQPRGEHLGQSFVMGGANGEMGPFAGNITIDAPTAAAGAVIFTTESAEDGSLQEATVVRVVFADAANDDVEFSVFFHRDEELVEIRREAPRSTGVLRLALESLFRGPDDDEGDDLSSFFSEETAELLAGVNLRADGTAVVDLADTVANASSSTGSKLFLEALDATVFQFSTVERIEYRLRGSCDDFWEWLQLGDCRLVDRS
jgi:hypothetical protein